MLSRTMKAGADWEGQSARIATNRKAIGLPKKRIA